MNDAVPLFQAPDQEAMFAAILEGSDAMVQAVDLQGRWIALNRSARHGLAPLYAQPPELGGEVLAMRDVAFAEPWRHAWRTALGGQRATTAVATVPDAAAGGWRTCDLRLRPLLDADGRVCGHCMIAQDATHLLDPQRRPEDEVQRQPPAQREIEERYRLAALATNDAIWDWRLADGHVTWSQALSRLFGHARIDSDADWWLAQIHPDDRRRIDQGIHSVILGGGLTWSDEYRFRRADGSYAHVFDRGTVLRGPDGQALRMIGAMLDLTERKGVEAALRLSENRFRTLFELMDEGFCVIEFIDGPHGPLSDYVHVLANPAYAANAGIRDVVGQKVRDMVPDEAEGWVAIYREVLRSGRPVRFERELVATGRHLELSAFRVEPPESRQVAVLFQDVTERRRAEIALRDLNQTLERRVEQEVAERLKAQEALRQSQKMEAVGQLTGGIAHDFNNMLAVVMGSLELLGRRFVGDDPRALRHVESAKDSARRAAQLTQRLLAFSRQQQLSPESLDVNRLVAGMADLLRHSLGADIRLDTSLSPELWHTHADPNQLENVVLNLAVNARDAMPEGGRLLIRTANVPAGALPMAAGQTGPQRDFVCIAVTDSGTGMAPEVLARAFEPFFTTKAVGRGTGLGLSQVYGFVRQSGGHVDMESTPGQGTTVRLYLPRATAAAPAPAAAFPSAPPAAGEVRGPGERMLVLVVDDEPAVRQFSADALQELGYDVLQADGARRALRLLEERPDIQLLFTDVLMPDMNGRRLADEVLRRRPGLPVLFTTGYAQDVMAHNGVLDQGVLLLGKPFTIDQLAARVREALDAAAAQAPPPPTEQDAASP